jgi:hypothetical protein
MSVFHRWPAPTDRAVFIISQICYSLPYHQLFAWLAHDPEKRMIRKNVQRFSDKIMRQ